MERVEWIEDLDVRGFCAQGIVSVGACIRTFTAYASQSRFHGTVPFSISEMILSAASCLGSRVVSLWVLDHAIAAE
jgi:hypothetical protein